MDCFDSKQSHKIVFNQSESLSFNYRGMMDFGDFVWKLDEFIKLFKYLDKLADDSSIKVGDDEFNPDFDQPMSFYLDDETVVGTIRATSTSSSVAPG